MFAEPRTHDVKRPGADTALALGVQVALLPYALAIFAVSLPFFVWAGSFARNAVWMSLSFTIFAINWGVFYGVTNWLKTPQAEDLNKRMRLQVAGGLLWALGVVQMSAFADGAGPIRETLLLLTAAAGMVCIFFASPVLQSLAVVAPVAAVGPLWALFSRPESRQTGLMAAGGLALALAMAMIFNRMLRRQHALAVAHEALLEERMRVLETAERTARSKSDIVATLSHEIRNGLTGVTHVLAAAAGKGGRAAPSREQLNAALDAAQDLISVLNATLDAETAEAGRLAVETQAFEPVRLVRDLALLERPHALAKGLELTVHVDASLENRMLGAAMADPMRTRQIIANLVGNAVKYTVRGRVEVRIEPRGDDRLAIEVADTGPGLSAEELEQAFEPFRRVERTGAGVNGAGLGLSLSRQLARLMGGALETSSALGVGSCFTLLLPYDAACPCPQEPVEETLAAADPAPDVQRSLRVLIAEDDALNAAMLRAILEQLGHQVVHAQNGRRAVDLATVCEFDLVMLDGRMPVLDGPQTAAELRALPGAGGQMPIIAVIGGDADEARECTEAGADTVLRKPVSVAGVARAVADAAALTRQPRTEASRGAA